MAHPHGVSAAMPVAGLQRCDRSKITLISTTKPQEGGFGVVHHAHMNGIEVAVKFPKIKLTLRGKDLKNFEKEVALQAKVRHPHCVQMIAASLDPSDPFIVMEWVPGGDWFHRLGCEPPPPAHQRIRAVREISSAMQYLHDPLISIIHGDIKGLNILLMRDGSSKFCDFGGAVQVLTTASSMSSAGGGATQAATKAYEAPERFNGEPKSTATDVYAFGVLMWEFATCEVPFADHTGLIAEMVMRGVRPHIPSPLPEGFPADYFKLMQECWAMNPAQRPTAEQIHGRLLKMDPSARAVQGPLPLWDPTRTRAPASLLPSILAAMQAAPGEPNAHLAPILQAMVAEAAEIVRCSANVRLLMSQYQLTELEAQAVSVYTTDARNHGGLREQSIFFVYNAAIRSANPEDVELWSVFSFLFCTALDKLPAVAKTVFRGLDVPLMQLSHQHVAGGIVWLTSMISTTTDKAGTLLRFGTGASGRPGTLMQINAVDAKDISDFSKFKTENEYIIPPNSCHMVQVALSSAQTAALKEFGALPDRVDLIVMDQQKRGGGDSAFLSTSVLPPDSTMSELVNVMNDIMQLDPSQRPDASHRVPRFTTSATPAIGSTVCIHRDDGSDSTLLRARPTKSRSDDAFIKPKIAITGDDRLQLLQTTSAEGSAFSLVETRSGVQGYVQSKYIILAPDTAPAPAPAPAPVFDPNKCVLYNGYYYKSLGDHFKDSKVGIIEEFNLYDIPSGWDLCPRSAEAIHVCALHPWGSNCLVFADGSVFASKALSSEDIRPGSQMASNGLRLDGGRYGIDVASACATHMPFFLDHMWNTHRSQLEGVGYSRASMERKHLESMQSERERFMYDEMCYTRFRESDVLLRRRA